MFKNNFKVDFTAINAVDAFLEKLKGIEDPENKRKIIGEEFIHVFTEFAEKNGPFKWLAQGTLYPDVIESGNPDTDEEEASATTANAPNPRQTKCYPLWIRCTPDRR